MNRPNIAPRNRIPASLIPLCIGLMFSAASSPLWGQDVWTGAGKTDLWSDKANWSNGIPGNLFVPPDLIMLGPGHLSNTYDLAKATEINSIQFPAGAPNFLLHIRALTIEPIPSNPGIFNDSGRLQIIEVVAGKEATALEPGFLKLYNGATVSGAVLIENRGGFVDNPSGGTTQFDYFSSAGNATINNFDSTPNATNGVGSTLFTSHSTAGNAVIANIGGTTTGSQGGFTLFEETANYDRSNAGNATIHNLAATAVNASGGYTVFGSETAGGNATIVNDGTNIRPSGGVRGAFTSFGGTADHATITNNSGRFLGGETDFVGNSTAGNALIINNGAGAFGQSGKTVFEGVVNQDTPSAGDATIVNQGGGAFLGRGGETIFGISSTAGNSTLIANAGVPATGGKFGTPGGLGGTIFFNEDSNGGTAHVQLSGNGSVDISGHDASGVTIGSLNGDGQAFLGANKLSVGSDNSDEIFYGSLHDGGDKGGTGGSFTKVGSALFALEGNSDYTGATTVNSGKLIVDANIASSSGVTVNSSATLAGHGVVSSISGAGTIAPAGTIALGNSPGILTATQLNPTGGTDFTFELSKVGSPTYSNAAASGNDVLHLMDLVPFTSALTFDNQITIDFSGATLAADQLYRGGFFVDGAIDPSLIDRATFLYLGLNGFSVQFDGFVTEAMADFAGGAITNGEVLQFEIEKGTSTVPDWSPSWLLLALALLLLSIPYGLRPTATR